jgi:hypothetical protein
MPLQAITVPSPAFYGVNKSRRDMLLPPGWATEGRNCVIDAAGRIACRKGWTNQTTTAMTGTPTVLSLHEYLQNDGTSILIAASSTKLWHSTDNGATWADKTGAVTTPTGGNWQFVNFNGKVYGAQVGHALVTKTTTGDFATATAATGVIPANPVCVWAAFGRLWTISSDYQTLKWSALLDATKWATADGGGSQDLGYLWTKGTDQGLAIGAYGSRLVVFGKRHIFLFTDGSGSDRGLDPSTMYVEDTIEGIGIVSRDTVQSIGEGDLVFLSQSGLRSIHRVAQEKATPLSDLSGNNRDYIAAAMLVSTVDPYKMRSVFSPEEGMYLLSSPDSQLTLYFDIRAPLEDGTFRMFNWQGFRPYSMCRRINGDVLFGWTGGIIGKYYGYQDNSSAYRMVYRGGFMDLGEEQNGLWKSLKRIKLISYSVGPATAVVKWWWDFSREPWSTTITFEGDASDQYATDEYEAAQYGGTTSQRIDYAPLAGSGQFFQLGLEMEINGAAWAIQTATMYYEPGRQA